jgi:hypothetical protein
MFIIYSNSFKSFIFVRNVEVKLTKNYFAHRELPVMDPTGHSMECLPQGLTA